MTLNSTQFEIVCFFTLGFLCLVGFVGLCLSVLFKSRIYYYYGGYILSDLLFIACVYCKAAHWIPLQTYYYDALQLVIDVVQMIGSFMFGAFIYLALIKEDEKFKKLHYVFQFYSGFIIIYILSVLLFPRFVLNSIPYFIGTRVIVVLLSLIFYYHIIKEFRKTYFKFLFLAITFLLLSGFLAFWDSISNYNSGYYVGFQYLCVGYILENICFVCAFIYKYFSTDLQKNEAEIKHELQLSVVQLEMQHQTMQHIGREIHDNVGQKLTLASLYTQQLAYENKAPLVNNTIENISDIINQSLNELRQLSRSLTINAIDNTPLEELLKIECARFNELKKCTINFVVNSKIPDLSYQTKNILLRISQEFIQNSSKHSECTNINIVLNCNHGILQIVIDDNGKGFDLNKVKKGGAGLIHMKTRAELIGATYHMASSHDVGTKLTIELPL